MGAAPVATSAVSAADLAEAKKRVELLTWAATRMASEGNAGAGAMQAKADQAVASYNALKQAKGTGAPMAAAPVAAAPYVEKAHEKAAPYIAKVNDKVDPVLKDERVVKAVSALKDKFAAVRERPADVARDMKDNALDLIKYENLRSYRDHVMSAEFQADTARLIKHDLPALAMSGVEGVKSKAINLLQRSNTKISEITGAFKVLEGAISLADRKSVV